MKRYICLMLFLCLAFCLIINTQAFAARTLYDDFSGNLIDNSKWIGLELVREVVAGKLVSKIRNDRNGLFLNHIRLQNPSSINTIKTDITVGSTNLNTGIDSISYAMVIGFFYNTQSSGGATGDVHAALFIGDRGSGLEAFWEVAEYLDDNWTSFGIKGSGTLIEPGTLDYNIPYTAKIAYDGDKAFQFTVDGVSGSFIGPSRLRPAVGGFKSLSTGMNSPNGSGVGFASALFDNVYLNNEGTVYDDFSTSPLDQTKWSADEVVAEIANGKLRLNSQGFDQRSQITLPLAFDDTPYLEAKMRIENSSQVSPGARAIARIQGFYYNDSRGPGSGQDYNGYEDDVFAQVLLQLEDNGDLKAKVIVDRSDDANQTAWTVLFSEDFATLINFDTDYTLSIEFIESKLIFKCNDETLEYDITTPMYTPFGEHRYLRSRVYLDPGEFGYIKAQFDDVYVKTEQSVQKAMPWIPLLLLDD